MNVVWIVGRLVVMSVMRGPPNRTALACSVAEHRSQELNSTACLEGAMRKISMIESRDAKNSSEVYCKCDGDRYPTPTDDKDKQACRMQ
jgi:hypothetical protein